MISTKGLINNRRKYMSIKTLSNYNPGIDISAISISEATYMLNSFIEESINDLQIKCLLTDKRSLNESGVRYFTEENDTGKQKLGDKIKQIIKTVWDVIVGIFKKIRDFFKDMITKIKDFFSKIQQKFFGKKEDKKKEEPKATEKPSEKKEENKPRSFNTEKINTVQDENGIHLVDQKGLIQYMENLDDKVFRDSIDKNITKYYDIEPFSKYAHLLSLQAGYINRFGNDENDATVKLKNDIQNFLSNPSPQQDKSSIDKRLVLDCAFGNLSIYYKGVDNVFKNAEGTFDKLSKNSDELDPQFLPAIKDILKLTTTCSKKYSSVMIHNTKELMKVVHYIYNNYDRDGVSVKESVDWSSIL